MQVGSQACRRRPAPTGAGPLTFGANNVWGEHFRGLIDEVRIYNRALSAAEIAADMDAPGRGGHARAAARTLEPDADRPVRGAA